MQVRVLGTIMNCAKRLKRSWAGLECRNYGDSYWPKEPRARLTSRSPREMGLQYCGE